MDKIDQLLDLIEHPEHYTQQQIEDLLQDPETNSLYRTLCETSASLHGDNDIPDVDNEWQRFTEKHHVAKKQFTFRRNIAAVIITVISLSAVAAGIGISMSTAHRETGGTVEDPSLSHTVPTIIPDTIFPVDSLPQLPESVIFENQSLRVVLPQIVSHYGLKAGFDSAEIAELRMYFKWNTSDSVGYVLETLNTFEQINIEVIGDSIAVTGNR